LLESFSESKKTKAEPSSARVMPNLTFLHRLMKSTNHLNQYFSTIKTDDPLTTSSSSTTATTAPSISSSSSKTMMIKQESRLEQEFKERNAKLKEREAFYLQSLAENKRRIGISLIRQIANEFGIQLTIHDNTPVANSTTTTTTTTTTTSTKKPNSSFSSPSSSTIVSATAPNKSRQPQSAKCLIQKAINESNLTKQQTQLTQQTPLQRRVSNTQIGLRATQTFTVVDNNNNNNNNDNNNGQKKSLQIAQRLSSPAVNKITQKDLKKRSISSDSITIASNNGNHSLNEGIRKKQRLSGGVFKQAIISLSLPNN